ncbi:hypothetical protein PLICRDRAFT_151562 [Plicaturopsis crispa FD-325 SS-3]|nr:hypothetical protein PLICRDRAFT_151562 [Plicaturopsis crispa FD-325 SS-3]
MPGVTYPPFPDDVPTHPLIVIDFERIQARDEAEIDKLWEASTKLGFWYLKNHGADQEVSDMYDMGKETMALPLDEKNKFEQGKEGMSFGYKGAGVWAIDASGAPDTVEFINVAKDDIVAWPKQVHRAYPPTVNARMNSTLKPFVEKSLLIHDTLLDVFNDCLGLPEGTLRATHKLEEPSGTETRCIKNMPRTDGKKASLGAHTDFGSISTLHNRLGGLQVLAPGTDDWQYIKPLPGHAICNLGDAMTLFSGGLLRSNMHRIVAPPGEQGKYNRWSLAFLSRPGDSVPLRALVEDSPIIAEAAAARPQQNFETGSTAGQWFARRVRNQRLDLRKGPETWNASRGTEHAPDVY